MLDLILGGSTVVVVGLWLRDRRRIAAHLRGLETTMEGHARNVEAHLAIDMQYERAIRLHWTLRHRGENPPSRASLAADAT